MFGSEANWLTRQPLWLKVGFFGVALPAWLYLVVQKLEGNESGFDTSVAFGIFVLVTIAFILANRNGPSADQNESGIEFYSSSGESSDE